MVSTCSTPGYTGWPGKCPAKIGSCASKLRVPRIRRPGKSMADTLSTKRIGGRCGISRSISATPYPTVATLSESGKMSFFRRRRISASVSGSRFEAMSLTYSAAGPLGRAERGAPLVIEALSTGASECNGVERVLGSRQGAHDQLEVRRKILGRIRLEFAIRVPTLLQQIVEHTAWTDFHEHGLGESRRHGIDRFSPAHGAVHVPGQQLFEVGRR